MRNKNKNASQSGGKRSLLTLLMFFFALAACAMAGYLIWEMKFAAPRTDAVVAVQPPIAAPVDPLYLSMNTFTVSLKPTANEADRVLYLGLSVRLADRQSLLVLEKYLPEYRSRLFMLLTQQTYESLSTDEGKKRLIQHISSELSLPLDPQQKIYLTDVLINEFILR